MIWHPIRLSFHPGGDPAGADRVGGPAELLEAAELDTPVGIWVAVKRELTLSGPVRDYDEISVDFLT